MKIKVHQGKFVGDKYIQPDFPVTDETATKMIESGVAEVTTSNHARWGSGIYEKVGTEWICVSSDWDTSG